MSNAAVVSLAFVIAWSVLAVVHALWAARDAAGDPAPPEPPEEHAHH